MSNIKREELALAISDYVLINETPVGTKMYPEDLKITLGSLLSPKDLIAIMQLIDQYSQGKVDEAVEPLNRILEKLNTEKCPVCTEYMIDDDLNICEACNNGVHEWCTGYTYDGDGEYPAESACAICKTCFDKSKAQLADIKEVRSE